jgi:hypothetical protein
VIAQENRLVASRRNQVVGVGTQSQQRDNNPLGDGDTRTNVGGAIGQAAPRLGQGVKEILASNGVLQRNADRSASA